MPTLRCTIAMWPGLVGKGPDSEPPIDLDTMLDLTADGRRGRGQVRRRRPVPFAAAHRYRFHRMTIWRRLAEKLAARACAPVRWWRRCGRRRAAAPRWAATDERAAFPDAGEEGLPHRQQAARSRRSGSTAWSASIRRPARRDWAKDPGGQHEAHRGDIPRGRDDRRRFRRAAGGGGRNLLGRHA